MGTMRADGATLYYAGRVGVRAVRHCFDGRYPPSDVLDVVVHSDCTLTIRYHKMEEHGGITTHPYPSTLDGTPSISTSRPKQYVARSLKDESIRSDESRVQRTVEIWGSVATGCSLFIMMLVVLSVSRLRKRRSDMLLVVDR